MTERRNQCLLESVNRLERLHAISEHLRRAAPNPVSAASLADHFEVTRRTIERDLAALRNAGVPLYSEHGRTGGHISIDRPGNAVLSLSVAEVSALLVALAAAGPNMPFNDAGSSAAQQLVESLSPSGQIAVEDLRSRVRLPQQHAVPKRARRTIEDALRRSVVVNIDYADSDGSFTTRSVDPVGFYNGTKGWYLIGWCHLRADGRIFRLDRVRGARLTTQQSGHHDVDQTLGWTPDELTTA